MTKPLPICRHDWQSCQQPTCHEHEACMKIAPATRRAGDAQASAWTPGHILVIAVIIALVAAGPVGCVMTGLARVP